MIKSIRQYYLVNNIRSYILQSILWLSYSSLICYIKNASSFYSPFILDELFKNFEGMRRIDEELQDAVQSIINIYWKKVRKSSSKCRIAIGGSTVEGAMCARYCHPKHERPVNEEVEVDFNILICDIPSSFQFLVEDIPGKPGNVTVKCEEEFFRLIFSDYDANCFKKGQSKRCIMPFHLKEALIGEMKSAKLMELVKKVLSISMKQSVEAIELKPYSEILKASSATDIELIVDGNSLVNVSTDMALMIRVSWWPSVANEWKDRERAWPCKNEIDQLTQHCFIIAKPSDDEKTNFNSFVCTYSFYHIESKLANMRSKKQNFVYFIFKCMIYKHVKPIDSERIPSFWGKTIMFQMMENYPPDHKFWDDTIQALSYLFNVLKGAIQTSFLKYFFIPSINIMKELPKTIKEEVICKINSIINNLETHLLRLPIEEGITFYNNILYEYSKIKSILVEQGKHSFFFLLLILKPL